MARQAADEPGTRTYRWFTAGADGYAVIEEYVDEDAATAHDERAAELLERVGRYAEMVHAEVYGTIGPRIGEWVRGHPRVTAFPDLA